MAVRPRRNLPKVDYSDKITDAQKYHYVKKAKKKRSQNSKEKRPNTSKKLKLETTMKANKNTKQSELVNKENIPLTQPQMNGKDDSKQKNSNVGKKSGSSLLGSIQPPSSAKKSESKNNKKKGKSKSKGLSEHMMSGKGGQYSQIKRKTSKDPRFPHDQKKRKTDISEAKRVNDAPRSSEAQQSGSDQMLHQNGDTTSKSGEMERMEEDPAVSQLEKNAYDKIFDQHQKLQRDYKELTKKLTEKLNKELAVSYINQLEAKIQSLQESLEHQANRADDMKQKHQDLESALHDSRSKYLKREKSLRSIIDAYQVITATKIQSQGSGEYSCKTVNRDTDKFIDYDLVVGENKVEYFPVGAWKSYPELFQDEMSFDMEQTPKFMQLMLKSLYEMDQ